MAKGSSGGKRGGSAGGGEAEAKETSQSPTLSAEVKEGYILATNLDLSDKRARISDEDSKKLDSFLNNVEAFQKATKDAPENVRKEATKAVDKAINNAIEAKVLKKWGSTSGWFVKEGGSNSLHLGQGSFNIKDKLKANGFKWNSGALGYNRWSKSYDNQIDAYKDMKKLDLIQ
jgi:hypothetical protein